MRMPAGVLGSSQVGGAYFELGGLFFCGGGVGGFWVELAVWGRGFQEGSRGGGESSWQSYNAWTIDP